jgi:hypothetical protein
VNTTNSYNANRCAPRLYVNANGRPAQSAGALQDKIYTEPNALP